MFDHKEYKTNLRFLLDKAYEEYKTVSFEIPNQQFLAIKTYLWLGSIMGAAAITMFSKIITTGTGISFLSHPPYGLFYFFASCSLLLSLTAFTIGVDAMREREKQGLPFGNFMDLEKIAHEDAQKTNYYSFQASILNSLNKEIITQAQACDSRGKTLRVLSFLQLFSLASTILSIISLMPT